MTTNAPPRETQDRPLTWQVQAASERGAAHIAAGLPNQDAVSAYLLGEHGAVAAVADGHGHHRHFRSARGSRLAVSIGCQAAEDLTTRLDQLATADLITGETRSALVPAIADLWRAAVAEDLAAEPITDDERAWQAAGDDDVIAYGSTLLLAVVWRHWLVLAQIGDGDIVCVQPDGGALLPVPGDPALDGLQTTSLCEPRAADAFRVAVVDTSRTALAGVMLATDGYGNAQQADPWPAAFSRDLTGLLRDHDAEWLAAQLPSWAARCASADGSADDTTVALLLAPVRHWPPPALPKATIPADVTRTRTEPVVLGGPDADVTRTRTEPVVLGGPDVAAAATAGTAGPAGPAAGRRPARTRWVHRIVLLAAVLVVIAAALVGLKLWRQSPAASVPRPHRCDAALVPATGTPVTGTVITACDAGPKRQVKISDSGLPPGTKVAVQADGSLFVLTEAGLYSTPITAAGKASWHHLAAAVGSGPRLCRSGGVVVADLSTGSGVVGSAGPAGPWLQWRVNPAAQPPAVTSHAHRAHPLCPAGPNR